MEHNPNMVAPVQRGYHQGDYGYNGRAYVPQHPGLPAHGQIDRGLAGNGPASHHVPHQASQQFQAPQLALQQQGYQQQQQAYWEDAPPQYQTGQTGNTPPNGFPPEKLASVPRRYCGLRKPLFLALLAVIGLVIVAIAVGVGVGVSISIRNRNSEGQATPSNTTSIPSPATTTSALMTTSTPAMTTTTTTTTSSSSTRTSSSSSAKSTATELSCPQANNTVYTASVGSKTFKRLCGIDFGGNGEATDVRNVMTRTMSECMNHCAAFAGCTGAGWGVMDSDKGDQHTCWMKKDLKKSHIATTDTWNFGMLQFDG